MEAILSLFMRVFRDADFTRWFTLLVEIVDFMIKASAAYRETDEGRKEWEDFAGRYETVVNNAENSGVEYSISTADAFAANQAKSGRVDDPKGGRK